MRLLLLGALPTVIAAAPPSHPAVDAHIYRVRIGAASLGVALRELAHQTGLQIARLTDDTVAEPSVGPVEGELTCTQALERLLAGTGLTYRFVNARTVAILNPSAPPRPPVINERGPGPGNPAPEAAPASTSEPNSSNNDTGSKTVVHRGFFARLGAVLGLCLPAAGVVCAQEAAPVTGGGLEEIIVTAQKRAESVQDIPIAITAVSTEELAELGIGKSRNIAAVVPNLRWIGNDGTAVSNVFIRGVGDISFHTNQVGAVGLYMDEVSLNSPILSSFGLFDLQRVEVLRGPQNTIFGRNTTGGAVQFVSQKPTLDGYGGRGSLTGGNFGRFDVEGAANIPIAGNAALRVAVARFAQGDYIDNVFLDRTQGAYHRTAGRVQLLWKATDTFDALLAVNAGQSRGGFTGYKQIGLGTPADPAAVQCPANLANAVPGNGCVDQTGFADSGNYASVSTNAVNLLETNAHGGHLRLDWRLPEVTITSLTAFEHSDGRRAEDSTGGPSYIFDFMQTSKANQWSEELRAVSRDDATVRWIGGLYFFDENARWTATPNRANQALTDVTVPGAAVTADNWYAFIPFTITGQKDRVYSAYAQVEIKFVDRLRLTAGLRYTSEKKSGLVKDGIVTRTSAPVSPSEFVDEALINSLLVGAKQVAPGTALRLACPPPGLPFARCYANSPFDLSNSKVGGKVSLDYRISDKTLTYVSISRGFKAGGISIGALDYVARGGSAVDPETLLTYEIGIKTQALADTLRINAAVFDNQWRDEQLFLPINTPGTGLNPVYTNVPRTESYGLEAEIEWAPTAAWYFKNSLGLLHSEVKKLSADLVASQGATVGSVLLASPEVTWNGMARRQWSLGSGTAFIEGDWSYTSSQHFDLINSPDQIEPSYWLTNASAGYQFGERLHYEVSIWGKNLAGTQYCTQRLSQAGVPFGNTAACVPNEARRFFGVSLRGTF